MSVVYDIELRGAALDVWEHWEEHDEILIDGPAGTGKSMFVAFFVTQIALHCPGCRILVVRKTRVSLTQSWMVTFRKAMQMAYGSGLDYLFEGAGDANRQEYNFTNGSVIVLGGMDNDTRLFSTEYDIVYGNEINEFTLAEWESLNRACRNGVVGHNLLLADCNPADEYHWMNLRCRGTALPGQPENGRTKRFKSRHEDNPWVTGTPEGQKYLDRLRNQLTGVRFRRLYLGDWVCAEGAMYPQFSAQTHIIQAKLRSARDEDYKGREQDAPTVWFLDITRGFGATAEEPQTVRLTWFFGAQDWGWSNPGWQGIYGVDAEGHMFLVWEHMRVEKTHEWWAKRAVEANKEFGLWKMICDCAEPEAIEVFNNLLSWKEREDNEPIAIGCEKTRLNGRTNIDLLRDRLLPRGDGHPGIFFLDNALQHEPDPVLVERAVPYSVTRELPGYVYMPVEPGKEDKERPKAVNNHGINGTEYAARYAHGRDMGAVPRGPEWSSTETWGAVSGLDPEEFKDPIGTQEWHRRRGA